MKKKTEIVKEAIKAGDFKKALKLAKDFRINVTKEQREAMARAHECIVHPEFYRQIGIDIAKSVESGKKTLVLLYGE